MLPAVNDGITSTILSNLRRNVGNVRFGEQGERKNIIRPSSDIVTTCQGMNLPLACNAFFAAISSPPARS